VLTGSVQASFTVTKHRSQTPVVSDAGR